MGAGQRQTATSVATILFTRAALTKEVGLLSWFRFLNFIGIILQEIRLVHLWRLNVHIRRWFLAVLFLSLMAAVWAQPLILPPAPFMLNDMVTICEVNHGGRVVLRYDVRHVGGQGLKLQLFLGRGKNTEKPVREFVYKGSTGTHKLDLHGVPIAVYRVHGIPLGSNDELLAGGERPVYLCWGGGRAWRAFDKTTLDANGAKAPFQDAKVDSKDSPTLEVDPPGVVVNQGEVTPIKAFLRGLPPAEELEWKLEGSGQLKVVDGRNALYQADPKAGLGRNAVIKITCKGHPELRANVTVVVTGVRSSELKNP